MKTAAATSVQTPIVPISWSVPAWFIDPQNVSGTAKDTNDCQTASTACVSFNEIIVHRLGTNAPNYTILVTFTWLSNDVAADTIFFYPNRIGANAGVVLAGTPTHSATFPLTTFAAKNRATATKASVTSTGHTFIAGQFIEDTTAGATFIVDGGGLTTTTISEPLAWPIVPFAPARATPVNGDTLRTTTFPTIMVGDLGGADDLAGSGAVIDQLTLESDGNLNFRIVDQDWFAGESNVAAGFSLIFPDATIAIPVFAGCYFPAISGGFSGISGLVSYFGGIAMGGGAGFSSGTTLDGDIIVNGSPHVVGTLNVATAYFAAWMDGDGGSQLFYAVTFGDFGGTGQVAGWGPAAPAMHSGAAIVIPASLGQTFAATLLYTGAYSFDGSANGFPWVAGSNSYGAAVAITTANLDAKGGLSNPATGTRITQ